MNSHQPDIALYIVELLRFVEKFSMAAAAILDFVVYYLFLRPRYSIPEFCLFIY